ncbi:MAG TPA: hypothetical protein VKU02_06090, partial [Gemmataceae bacterium]|nr:hypothetical protein [Gemmataceae bacterium]
VPLSLQLFTKVPDRQLQVVGHGGYPLPTRGGLDGPLDRRPTRPAGGTSAAPRREAALGRSWRQTRCRRSGRRAAVMTLKQAE